MGLCGIEDTLLPAARQVTLPPRKNLLLASSIWVVALFWTALVLWGLVRLLESIAALYPDPSVIDVALYIWTCVWRTVVAAWIIRQVLLLRRRERVSTATLGFAMAVMALVNVLLVCAMLSSWPNEVNFWQGLLILVFVPVLVAHIVCFRAALRLRSSRQT